MTCFDTKTLPFGKCDDDHGRRCGHESDSESVRRTVAANPTVAAATDCLVNIVIGVPPKFTKTCKTQTGCAAQDTWKMEPTYEALMQMSWKEFIVTLLISFLMYVIAVIVLVEDAMLGKVPKVLDMADVEVFFEIDDKTGEYKYTVKRNGRVVRDAIVIERYKPDREDGTLTSPYAKCIRAVEQYDRSKSVMERAE